jgi:ABC-type iron transport system FetAB ATPase subunit
MLTNTGAIDVHNVFCLIVGSSGVGKTTLAKTLEESRTLIISAESGLLSLKGTNIDVYEVNSSNEVKEAIAYAVNNQDKYDNLFFDSLTEIGEIFFSELKPKYDKKQNFNLYEHYTTELTKLLKWLRDLKGFNKYLTCLDKMVQKDFTEVISIDLIQKSLAKKIPALFDEVFYMAIHEKEDGTNVRAICTDNSVIDFAKDRSGKLNKYEKPDLGIITNKILG